jgi:hypothetical protein
LFYFAQRRIGLNSQPQWFNWRSYISGDFLHQNIHRTKNCLVFFEEIFRSSASLFTINISLVLHCFKKETCSYCHYEVSNTYGSLYDAIKRCLNEYVFKPSFWLMKTKNFWLIGSHNSDLR